MSLNMKPACQRCGSALAVEGEAYICAHECSFCRRCAEEKAYICPNCGGELVRRPRRRAAAG